MDVLSNSEISLKLVPPLGFPFRPLVIRTLTLLFCIHGMLAAESRYVEDYPATTSKKGLQVEMVDDALALGVKHAALNVNLSQLVDPERDSGEPRWAADGKVFHFKEAALARLL